VVVGKRIIKSFCGYNPKNNTFNKVYVGITPKNNYWCIFALIMIPRNEHIEAILPFVDKPIIKVINGIRRSGKSTLLKLLQQHLIQKRKVTEDQIIYINFESFEFRHISNEIEFYNLVKEHAYPRGKTYIFVDEIQEIEKWEKAINAFTVDLDCDVYITGSNSQLLSSELSTYLAGRYVEFHVQTLSFSEAIQFESHYAPGEKTQAEIFQKFIRQGAFPILYTSNYEETSAHKLVADIFNSAVLRDTIQRFNIRNVELLERVINFLFDNLGNTFSAHNVAVYFKSQNRTVDTHTVYNYLNALESAFIVYKIPRFDIKGKELLKTQEKYFLSDLGLLYAKYGFKDRFISGILENMIMLEMKRRGYKVHIGKLDNLEIDFIGLKQNERIYIQVAYLLTEQTTIDREFAPLLQIKDSYPKFVVSMNESWKDNIEGVKQKYIPEFLLKKW